MLASQRCRSSAAHARERIRVTETKRITKASSCNTSAAWLAPDAWITSVTAALPSVDVDTLTSYTHLLQECIVQEPKLLLQQPQEAAAVIWNLERCLRASVAWFGPKMCSQLLLSHTSESIQQHLQGLLQVWLDAGETPHTFGSLWLEAPTALLHRDHHAFAAHLGFLQAQLPDNMLITRLLASSSSLAGYLLSLDDAQQLRGFVHVSHGYLIFAPNIIKLRVREETSSSGGEGGADEEGSTLGVYGVYCDRNTKNAENAEATESPNQSPAYGWQAATSSNSASMQQMHNSSGIGSSSGSRASSSSSVISQQWSGRYGVQGCTQGTQPQQLQQSEAGLTKHVLLMRLRARAQGSSSLTPVLLLPPMSSSTGTL